jgi:tetratricopeptide (TPR) repeat protein
MNPKDSRALTGKGIVLMEQGDIDSSIKILEMAAEVDALNAWAFKCLGESLHKAKKHEEAL